MLFVIIGQIATGSDFTGIAEAPVYLLMGVRVVLIHGAIMVAYAKVAKADLFNIKLAKTGGLEDAVRIADLAAEHGIGCMVGSMMEPRISIGAAVHLSLAHPADTMVDLDAPLWFASTAPEGGFEQAGGTVRLTGGGLAAAPGRFAPGRAARLGFSSRSGPGHRMEGHPLSGVWRSW